MSGWLLGIDAGGSGTQARLVTRGGPARIALGAGPCNWTTQPVERCLAALDAIAGAARAAIAREQGGAVEAVCLCSAGYYPPHHAGLVTAAVAERWPAARIRLETDLSAAWAGALGGEPGVVLVAGTGSVAYGRLADGREARAGGWGPLFSDEGSGYWLGCRALAAVAEAADSRGPATALSGALRRLRPADDGSATEWLRALLRANPGRDQIAALAPSVFEAMERGDAVASRILRAAAAELARMARAVERALNEASLRWSWSGGVLGASATLRQWVEERLSADGSSLKMVAPRAGPEEGALLLAQLEYQTYDR